LCLHSVLFAPAAEDVDLLIADLNERGTAGIIEEGAQIRAFFEDEIEYSDLLSVYPVLEMRRESTSELLPLDEDCDPILAGEKFFIVPAVSKRPTPGDRYRLTINDTAAFGTGRHESTQLMLAALEQMDVRGRTVLDIGTGSGILARAARLLGARQVWSCDIYEDSARSCHDHYSVPVFVGSADAIRDRLADVTLANISARVLDVVAYDLGRVSADDGRILISGFLRGSEPRCFKPEKVWEQEGWLCWLCRREDVDLNTDVNTDVNGDRIHRGHNREHGQIAIHDQEWW
jgi:ribosomal protein L11 methyltransferase